MSSSRGVFGSLENKRKRREKRGNQTLTKAARYLHKMKIVPKDYLGLQNGGGGGGGAYIGHPMYENTRKPNILAKIRDKGVIHQNEVGLH